MKLLWAISTRPTFIIFIVGRMISANVFCQIAISRKQSGTMLTLVLFQITMVLHVNFQIVFSCKYLATIYKFAHPLVFPKHKIKYISTCVPTLGVPATSRILMGDCQKFSFSILRKVPFLIFWSDKPYWRTSSAHLACSAKLSSQARRIQHNFSKSGQP